MPKKLEECVKALQRQGKTLQQAYAICTAAQQSKKPKPKR